VVNITVAVEFFPRLDRRNRSAVADYGEVAGYYTIAATGLGFGDLPPARAKKLPRYPMIPAILLGRLAVATAHQGKRLGGAHVADALARAEESDIMAYAMVVDVKDTEAVRFYAHLGFESLLDNASRLLRRHEYGTRYLSVKDSVRS
jgi:GNAT superfamily N-acetyltransferase